MYAQYGYRLPDKAHDYRTVRTPSYGNHTADLVSGKMILRMM